MEGDAQQTPKPQFLVIKIPKPQHLERLMWVFVTIALGIVAFYQPISSSVSCNADLVTANWFGSSETTGAVVNVNESVKTVSEPVIEKPVVEKVEEPIVKEKPKILSGLIDFKILKVNTVKKSDNWGKIVSVEYEIVNEKTDFYPLVRVFAYDESDGEDVKKLVKGEKESIFSIAAGETIKGVIVLSDGSFDDLSLAKTITLQLLDQGSDKLLKAITTITTIN